MIEWQELIVDIWVSKNNPGRQAMLSVTKDN
jgi:hypothetical protein